MNYQIDNYRVCTLEGLAQGPEGAVKIRPKTLQVLEYLLAHRDRIVTKRELLETIWDDVVVQEQVLFQSIKELRDLFVGITVIKTFPRKGYQWVGPVECIDASVSSPRSFSLIWRYGLVAALVLLLAFAGWWLARDSRAPAFDIAVLPVVNEMDDRDHQWVRLGGMDILIHQLAQVEGLKVFDTDEVLYGLERSDAYVEPTVEEQVYRLRQSLGADVIVVTRLKGYPQDYQLHYSIITPVSVERGVEFADSVQGLMAAMTQTLAARFDAEAGVLRSYQSDFSNEAFASGVELYLSSKYVEAEPFLRAALAANPDLLAARRFLAAALAHEHQLQPALDLLDDNIARAERLGNRREQVRAVLMIGTLLADVDRTEEAAPYLTRARELAEAYGDQLFIAYAYEELGKIQRRNGAYAEAEYLLQTALKYQQSFQCPYGQTSVLIELGNNAYAMGNHPLGERYLQRALDIANQNGVAVNRFWTLLALAQMHEVSGDLESSRDYARQARALASDVHDDYLLNKADHWLSQSRSEPL